MLVIVAAMHQRPNQKDEQLRELWAENKRLLRELGHAGDTSRDR
jgi:hypothetical protein